MNALRHCRNVSTLLRILLSRSEGDRENEHLYLAPFLTTTFIILVVVAMTQKLTR
ncbi:hypothetical protein YC2023_107085 [Brassica napus]